MTELKKQAHDMIDTLSESELSIIIGAIKKVKIQNDIDERLSIARSLYGSIPASITLEEARAERISKI